MNLSGQIISPKPVLSFFLALSKGGLLLYTTQSHLVSSGTLKRWRHIFRGPTIHPVFIGHIVQIQFPTLDPDLSTMKTTTTIFSNLLQIQLIPVFDFSFFKNNASLQPTFYLLANDKRIFLKFLYFWIFGILVFQLSDYWLSDHFEKNLKCFCWDIFELWI